MHINKLLKLINKISHDDQVTLPQLSLYLGLLSTWAETSFENPFYITRSTLITKTKISSFVTYHKSMRNLQDLGYVNYIPSFNPDKGSQVFIVIK